MEVCRFLLMILIKFRQCYHAAKHSTDHAVQAIHSCNQLLVFRESDIGYIDHDLIIRIISEGTWFMPNVKYDMRNQYGQSAL